MSLEVRIPKEITEYKEKILFGLSARQLICFGIGIVLCVGTYFGLTKALKLSSDIAGYVIMFEAMPIMAVGFIRKNGMTFEKYAALILRHKLGTLTRPYKTELLIEPKNELTERNDSPYAWIFENKKTNASLSRRDARKENRRREWETDYREALQFQKVGTRRSRFKQIAKAQRAAAQAPEVRPGYGEISPDV